jgi:hypothetical protein
MHPLVTLSDMIRKSIYMIIAVVERVVEKNDNFWNLLSRKFSQPIGLLALHLDSSF